MVYYTKDEIQSSTAISRNFGGLLDSLRDKKLDKVAVIRNNKMEAVIIPLEEYQYLKESNDLIEHKEIYKIIKEREKEAIENSISFESILKENKIKINDL